MKKLLLAALLFSSANLFAQKKADDIAKFSTETYDFGKVKQNTPPTATITVTNIGTEPLIIEQASPSCGCTVSDYTKAPIAPGKTGTITATYNAAAVGPINKSLTVKFAGADDPKFIKLTGEVLTPDAYAAYESAHPAKKTKKESKGGNSSN
jgi:hypothetical protein